MEVFLFTIVSLIIGGLLGYGLRVGIDKELVVLHSDYLSELARLRADVAKIVAEVKAKI